MELTEKEKNRQRNYAEYVKCLDDDLNRESIVSYEEWLDMAEWYGVDVDAKQ